MKEKRSTIFADKAKTKLVLNTYIKESICKVHLDIAHDIQDYIPASKKKKEILDLLDNAFNMGKRMDEKLAFYRKELITDEYKVQNAQLHQASKGFGGSGYRWADIVLSLIQRFHPTTVLDYGCGQETLWKEVITQEPKYAALSYSAYDPAIPGRSQLPMCADLVLCTDVLEHVEPHLLSHVLNHLHDLTQKVIFFNIAIHPANKVLPDGRNAHLIVESATWWLQTLYLYFSPKEWHAELHPLNRPDKDFLVTLWN